MELFMPHLGASVEKGTIRNWFRSVGDTVQAGEPLFEVETDKTSLEIEASSDGVLAEVRVGEGGEASVGAIIGILDVGGAAANSVSAPVSLPPEAVPTVAAAVAPTRTANEAKRLEPFNEVQSPTRNYGPARLQNGTKVSPLARRLAVELGVRLDHVAGSAPRGRIISKDVLAFASGPQSPGPVDKVDSAAFAGVPHREVPLDRMRGAIASRMVQAKRDIPHFYISTDVNVDRLLECRKEFQAAHKTRVTINDFLLRALALALAQVPQANRVWAGECLLEFSRVDLGIAVAIDGGLVTPVVRDVAAKPLVNLAAETAQIVERARVRKLLPDELQGGVASLSNLGMFGVDHAQAIVNPPQSFIVATGRMRRVAVELPEGGSKFVSVINISVSADHRVMDGQIAANLLEKIIENIEHPMMILS